jgi:hypothetical protein
MFGHYAHKKGEVVVPAGGETGGPRCLAEVRKLPIAALFRQLSFQEENLTFPKEPVKQKNKNFLGQLSFPPNSLNKTNIQAVRAKCKPKIHFF